MFFTNHSYLILLFPLLGAAINGAVSFLDLKASRRFVYVVACTSIFLSFLVACGCFYELAQLESANRSVTVNLFSWLDMESLHANVAFLIDPLSVVMMLVVSGVGFLIHLYSTGYMNADPSFARFFSYLNLFCFAMLLLVMADNLLLMFVGWEGVGLCSYLLIGFWYEHKPNAVAGMKAFIVNRIGDFGFLIGMLALFWGMWSVGHPTVVFEELKVSSNLLGTLTAGPVPLVTLVCILLFFGATGKSAQIPLYVWLPDAMAGPTPVSALIHAATMVTAGVYMIARLNFLYAMSPAALVVVATVGGVTAVFAATIGFAQNDIKKVLAYSTVSQLGYMFLGMGTGIYASGIFHLMTHAFFKACLFLGSGCVILAMHHEQDMRKMGELKKFLPAVFLSFLAATLALAGVFPLSGFFSKDEILWQVFEKGGNLSWYYALWVLGLVGAFATAFYMFRCISLVFLGSLKRKADFEHYEADALESSRKIDKHYQPMTHVEYPRIMTRVVVVLAFLSVIGGFLGVPHALGKFIHLPNFFDEWLGPVLASKTLHEPHILHHAAYVEYLLMAVSVAIAVLGMFLALKLYTKRLDLVDAFTARFGKIYKTVAHMYYVDELYEKIFVRPLIAFNDKLKWFDNKVVDGFVNLVGFFGVVWAKVSGLWDQIVVDGAVNAVALGTIVAGKKIRTIQTGKIQHYFYVALLGLLVALAWSFVQ